MRKIIYLKPEMRVSNSVLKTLIMENSIAIHDGEGEGEEDLAKSRGCDIWGNQQEEELSGGIWD